MIIMQYAIICSIVTLHFLPKKYHEFAARTTHTALLLEAIDWLILIFIVCMCYNIIAHV